MLGDCLKLMKDIPDNSIDMCLTDPPYGTTQCKWDSVIDFKLMWEQLKRIVKDNGAICLFGSEPLSSRLRLSNIKMFKYDWIWEKHHKTGHLNAKKRPMKKCELISVFYERQPRYTPQGLIDCNKNMLNSKSHSLRTKDNATSTVSGGLTRKPYKQLKTNYPVELLKFNSCNGNLSHPTQKPFALLEYLIKTYTLENETVLDFTMGSGSTGVACHNLKRKFIGIEQDDKYFKIARQRIEDHAAQGKFL